MKVRLFSQKIEQKEGLIWRYTYFTSQMHGLVMVSFDHIDHCCIFCSESGRIASDYALNLFANDSTRPLTIGLGGIVGLLLLLQPLPLYEL